jgi:hypothetical protein
MGEGEEISTDLALRLKPDSKFVCHQLEPMLKLEIISAEYVAHNFPTAFDVASNLVSSDTSDASQSYGTDAYMLAT